MTLILVSSQIRKASKLTSDDFWSAASGLLQGHFNLQSNIPLSDFIIHAILGGLQSIQVSFTPRTPEMNDSKRDKEIDKEVKKKSTQTILTESSNPASIEMRLCTGLISLLQAKVHNLREQNQLLRAQSRYGLLPDSSGFKQETFQRKIPLKIQKLIQQYTLPASCIIQFTICKDYNNAFFSSGTPLVALHICSESRQEALSVYQPFFAFNHKMESMSRLIYFCLTRDILYFAKQNALRDAQLIYRFPEIKEIQSIALHYNLYSYNITESFNLSPFQNLAELILVVRYFNKPVFKFRCYKSTTFFNLDSR